MCARAFEMLSQGAARVDSARRRLSLANFDMFEEGSYQTDLCTVISSYFNSTRTCWPLSVTHTGLVGMHWFSVHEQ